MKRLEGIRATGTQRLTTTASNGDVVVIVLFYDAATQNFKIDVEWNDFILRGTRVFSSPNLLNQYENIIPFGLAVVTTGGGEPFLVNDFSSGRCNMYLLTPEEVVDVNDFYVSLRDAG